MLEREAKEAGLPPYWPPRLRASFTSVQAMKAGVRDSRGEGVYNVS